ncbi:MAG TPA: sigma-70 family RNA polymerase sigma factor [Blastocatellia bacterium]|nr:sigma-70 family RNA polymerase sigma factor [Blastocatellia bacterium]
MSDLLRRCATRPVDEDAWEEFICRYHVTIRAFVIRTFKQRVYADPALREQPLAGTMEDLMQAVYIKLINEDAGALMRFEGEHEHSIHSYLGIIATNVVRDHFRALLASGRPRLTFSLDRLIDAGDHALAKQGIEGTVPLVEMERDITVTQEEIEEVLDRVIKGRNSERDILIFKLRFFQDLSPNEISELFRNLPARQVSSILRRILIRIRPTLARMYGIRGKRKAAKP